MPARTTATHQPQQPTPLPMDAAAQTSITLIIGQLLEATKAANIGLKCLGEEVQTNARTLILISKTVDMLEARVGQIIGIVSDSANNRNLLLRVNDQQKETEDLHKQLLEIKKAVGELKGWTSSWEASRHKETGANDVYVFIGRAIGWVLVTGIALYAAIGQWMKP